MYHGGPYFKNNVFFTLYRVYERFKLLFFSYFWTLLKQVVFFEAAGAVAYIGLNQTIITKLISWTIYKWNDIDYHT